MTQFFGRSVLGKVKNNTTGSEYSRDSNKGSIDQVERVGMAMMG